MKRWLCVLVLLVALGACGCAGVGADKQATLVPDSVTVGWAQETYRGDPDAWEGFTFSATWEFKPRSSR